MIRINFASRNYLLTERIRSVLIACCVVLVLTAVGMIWIAGSLREKVSIMGRTLNELQAADEKTRSALVERAQLVKYLSAMTTLMESRKISWTGLLTSIESVVPVGVALKHVDFNPKDSTLTLDGTANSPESLRNLVVGMEKAPSFKDPFLKHQSLEKGSISFNVVAIYRDEKGAAVAQGKR